MITFSEVDAIRSRFGSSIKSLIDSRKGLKSILFQYSRFSGIVTFSEPTIVLSNGRGAFGYVDNSLSPNDSGAYFMHNCEPVYGDRVFCQIGELLKEAFESEPLKESEELFKKNFKESFDIIKSLAGNSGYSYYGNIAVKVPGYEKNYDWRLLKGFMKVVKKYKLCNFKRVQKKDSFEVIFATSKDNKYFALIISCDYPRYIVSDGVVSVSEEY